MVVEHHLGSVAFKISAPIQIVEPAFFFQVADVQASRVYAAVCWTLV